MTTLRIRPASSTVLALATLLLVVASPSRADLTLTADSSTATAGGTGSFDVVLSATGGTFDVSGFSIELSTPAGSGVMFTGVAASTTADPYIFGTVQMPPLTFDTFPNALFTASDSYGNAPGYVVLMTSNPVGLEHVTYSVAPGIAPGTVIPVSFVGLTGLAPSTEINDPNGAPIAFTAVNGSITVGTSAVVPEPSTIVTLLIGGACMAVVGVFRSWTGPGPLTATPCR